jgi:polysaccharide export outer membrane protein
MSTIARHHTQTPALEVRTARRRAVELMNSFTFVKTDSVHCRVLRALCFLGMASASFPISQAVCQTHLADPHLTFAGGAANLPAQRIGPNDLISVAVYDAPEFTRSVRVALDGTIILPMMQKAIPAAGLTPRELETRIATALREEHLLKEPSVVVTVAEYGARPIIVAGAVRSPVSFQAVGQVTLMDALTRAGGIAPEAGPEVLISDSQGSDPSLVRRILIKPLYDASDPKLNLILADGDEVRVPVASRISVVGNVKNTGSFPILDASDTTVLGALVLAGGFAGPKPTEAYIIRRDDSPEGTHQIKVPLKQIMDRKVPDVRLVAHDYLYIPNNRKSETFLMLEKIAGVAGSSAFLINVIK